MADFSNILYEKLNLLRESYRDFFAAEHEDPGCGYAAFISVCNTTERATVLRGTGDSPAAGYSLGC